MGSERVTYGGASWRPIKRKQEDQQSSGIEFFRGPSRLKRGRGGYRYITKDCKSWVMGTNNLRTALKIQGRWDILEWEKLNEEAGREW